MTGALVETEVDLGSATKALRAVSAMEIDALAYAIGALVEDQTKRRIISERKSPEGNAWPKWSREYGKYRKGSQTLLVGEGHLLQSVQNYTKGETVRVGSNMVYAAIHQFGGLIEPKKEDGVLVYNIGPNKYVVKSVYIPARPYLGLSDENRREIEDFVIGDLEALLQ